MNFDDKPKEFRQGYLEAMSKIAHELMLANENGLTIKQFAEKLAQRFETLTESQHVRDDPQRYICMLEMQIYDWDSARASREGGPQLGHRVLGSTSDDGGLLEGLADVESEF